MIRHFCDICGKEENKLGLITYKGEESLRSVVGSRLFNHFEMEICHDCAQHITKCIDTLYIKGADKKELD